MNEIDSNTRKNEFVYLSNRGSAIFKAALEPLGGRLFREGDRSISLLYFDQYGDKYPPAEVEAAYTLIDRQRTIPLDNKARMATLLADAGLLYPRVYFDDANVPDESGSLWFIKDPMATGGKGISVVTREQISTHFTFGCIIQEAVQDLALLEGRKFTLRAYVLVHDGKLYLLPEAITVLHGAMYDPGSSDPMVQFEHSGYMDESSAIKMSVFGEQLISETVMKNLELNMTQVFPAFSNFLKYEKAHTYCLFGVDVLVKSDLTTVLIEINDRPNLVHTRSINEAVNVPMVQALYCVLESEKAQLQKPEAMQFKCIATL
ncbi:MAG: hypothetical protein COA96_03450 [SAR86 cluster bacterium]|uniref:ATP-grasp domain-containing protein n=1 Tax=SAR86 cluster bacterium TaxID=2030880 RepID=A0A2A5B7F3_9GAMM|nr:MAG: hypothetical protein COA96_03450 [SAR86 cluster bacterium]